MNLITWTAKTTSPAAPVLQATPATLEIPVIPQRTADNYMIGGPLWPPIAFVL